VEPRSFDASRKRLVPKHLKGLSLSGVERSIEITSPTLVAAIKPNCDGCSEFVHGNLQELEHVCVVLISATSGDGEWESAPREILVAPKLLIDLDIRSAPYYVLIDPTSSSIVTEGALMSSAQVAREIERFIVR
jgi:hypothetical protein